MNNGISLVIPAYQEAESLRWLLPHIRCVLSAAALPFEILIIDTQKSMDHTEQVCREAEVSCIHRENSNSYGDAIRTGIRYAQYDKTVIMDADGSHDPEDIKRMLELMQEKNLDLVIGSRYIAGGNSFNGPVLKGMSLLLNLVFRMAFHIKAKDISNSFRMYRTSQLQSLHLQCQNFDIVEEILIRLSMKKGFHFQEIPVSFSKRQAGVSKRHLISFIFSYLLTITKLKRIIRKNPPK